MLFSNIWMNKTKNMQGPFFTPYLWITYITVLEMGTEAEYAVVLHWTKSEESINLS